MTLAYESSGRGTPLVLIHAFPLSASMWNSQMKNLSGKAKAISLDLPGFGRSPCEAGMSISKMAQKIAALLDELQLKEPAMIAGLSMGGYVALEFFHQFPERVKALGLFSTRAGADSLEAREKRLEAAEQILHSGMDDFTQKLLPQLVGKTTAESNPGLLREITGMLAENSRNGVAEALSAMADRRDSIGLLGSIRCPALIIAGAEDTLIVSSESEIMHQQIAGSELHILPKAGHLVNLEQPEAFQEAFEKFLIQKL